MIHKRAWMLLTLAVLRMAILVAVPYLHTERDQLDDNKQSSRTVSSYNQMDSSFIRFNSLYSQLKSMFNQMNCLCNHMINLRCF